VPEVKIKPGWRKIKGLAGYHKVAKPRSAPKRSTRSKPKRMTKKAMKEAVAGAIAHGINANYSA
jgi:hypothetical protein